MSASSPSGEFKPRDADAWAKPVDKLKVSGVPAGAINLNVDGRRVMNPLQGFGQLWQKVYRVRLSGVDVTPSQVIRVWKENFAKFWSPGNHFYAPLTSIAPGEVAVLNLTVPGGMPLSTGVIVIYADDESFCFMTPQGHMFAGMITFSSDVKDNCTCAQVEVLIRANDPIYEMGMRLGIAHKMEDDFWRATLESLAAHFGIQGSVDQRVSLIDSKMQWSQAKNIWHNAAVRTFFYKLAAPLRWVRDAFNRPPNVN